MKTSATQSAAIVIIVAVAVGTVMHFTGRQPEQPTGAGAIKRPLVSPPALDVQLPAGSAAAAFVASASSMGELEAVDAIARIPGDLTAAEQAALLEFLAGGMPGFAHHPRGRRHHIANDLMVALSRQAERSPAFVPAMGALIGDGSADPVVRDYAVQALGRWLADRRRASDSPESIGGAITHLLDTASLSGSALAGTALVALDYVAGKRREGSVLGNRWGQFIEALDTLASDGGAHPFARTSAMQVAARRARPGLAPIARQLAGDADQPPTTRASAIAALGQVGDPAADLARLDAYAESEHFQIGAAAKAATERLRTRL